MTIVDDVIAAELALLTREVPTPVVIGYGVDLLCVTDLTPRLDEIDPESTAGLAQDLYHRFITPRGSLPDDEAKDFGLDLRAYLHRPMRERDLLSMAGEIASECRKDDRVASVAVTVLAPTFKQLDVTIRVTPENPALAEFTLLIAVTDGATLLEAIT